MFDIHRLEDSSLAPLLQDELDARPHGNIHGLLCVLSHYDMHKEGGEFRLKSSYASSHETQKAGNWKINSFACSKLNKQINWLLDKGCLNDLLVAFTRKRKKGSSIGQISSSKGDKSKFEWELLKDYREGKLVICSKVVKQKRLKRNLNTWPCRVDNEQRRNCRELIAADCSEKVLIIPPVLLLSLSCYQIITLNFILDQHH